MSWNTGLLLNNIQREIDHLQTQINDLIAEVGITNPMVSNLDANNFNITGANDITCVTLEASTSITAPAYYDSNGDLIGNGLGGYTAVTNNMKIGEDNTFIGTGTGWQDNAYSNEAFVGGVMIQFHINSAQYIGIGLSETPTSPSGSTFQGLSSIEYGLVIQSNTGENTLDIYTITNGGVSGSIVLQIFSTDTGDGVIIYNGANGHIVYYINGNLESDLTISGLPSNKKYHMQCAVNGHQQINQVCLYAYAGGSAGTGNDLAATLAIGNDAGDLSILNLNSLVTNNDGQFGGDLNITGQTETGTLLVDTTSVFNGDVTINNSNVKLPTSNIESNQYVELTQTSGNLAQLHFNDDLVGSGNSFQLLTPYETGNLSMQYYPHSGTAYNWGLINGGTPSVSFGDDHSTTPKLQVMGLVGSTITYGQVYDTVFNQPVATHETLTDILTNGNSGGGLSMTDLNEITASTITPTTLSGCTMSGNLAMGTHNITGATDITCTGVLTYGSLSPPISTAGLSAVLTVSNNANNLGIQNVGTMNARQITIGDTTTSGVLSFQNNYPTVPYYKLYCPFVNSGSVLGGGLYIYNIPTAGGSDQVMSFSPDGNSIVIGNITNSDTSPSQVFISAGTNGVDPANKGLVFDGLVNNPIINGQIEVEVGTADYIVSADVSGSMPGYLFSSDLSNTWVSEDALGNKAPYSVTMFLSSFIVNFTNNAPLTSERVNLYLSDSATGAPNGNFQNYITTIVNPIKYPTSNSITFIGGQSPAILNFSTFTNSPINTLYLNIQILTNDGVDVTITGYSFEGTMKVYRDNNVNGVIWNTTPSG